MAGFTSSIDSFNPYIPEIPVDVYTKVGMYKQQMYDQGLQKVISYMDSVAGMPVDGKFAPYIKDKLDSLKDQVSKTTSGDFSDQQLVNKIGAMAGSLTKDPTIVNAITSSAAMNKDMQYIDDIRTKHPELYNAANFQDATRAITQWRSDPNLSDPYYNPHPYSPYYDTGKEISTLTANFMKMPLGYAQAIPDPKNPGGTITTTYSNKSSSQLNEYIQNNLSEAGRQQLAIEGRVNSDNMDGETWYNSQYVPHVNNLISQQKDNLTAQETQLQSAGGTNKQNEIQANIAQLKNLIRTETASLSDPAQIKSIIANKLQFAGDLYGQDVISRAASSLNIPQISEQKYGINQAMEKALDRANVLKAAEIRAAGRGALSNSSNSNGQDNYGLFGQSGSIPGVMQTQGVNTPSDNQVSGHAQFSADMNALSAQVSQSLGSTFDNWANTKGYTKTWLTNPDNMAQARKEWTAYMTGQYEKFQKNNDDPSVPQELKTIFTSNNAKLILLMGMEKSDDAIKASILQNAVNNGAKPININGVTISVADMVEYKLSGHNKNIEDSGGSGPGNSQTIVTPTGQVIYVPKDIANKTLMDHDLKEMLDKVPDVKDSYKSSIAIAHQGLYITNLQDVKNYPENDQAINTILTPFNGELLKALSAHSKYDASGANPIPIDHAISKKDLISLYVDRSTGNVTATIKDPNDKSKEKTVTLNLPQFQEDTSGNFIKTKAMTLQGGVLPFTTQGEKPLEVNITSNGTPESLYTKTADGGFATYSIKTKNGTAIKAPLPAGTSIGAVEEWLNNTVKVGQHNAIQANLDKEIPKRYSQDQWNKLTVEDQQKIKEDLINNTILPKIDEGTVFNLGDSPADNYSDPTWSN